jgi:probable O-glycosylation ligase (exosortase A-associated)
MVLPLLLVLRREASRPWVRHAMLAAFVLCLIASLMTYSRGALLGLAIVVAALLLRVRAKIALVVLLAVGIAVAPALIPEHWFTRMDTIATYQQDESAQTRLTAWGVAYSLALERPLGGGFRTLTAEVWSRFVPGWDRHTDAHSIYFQVLAEHGFVGLAVFLALILSTLATLRSVKPDPAREPELAWLGYWARMLEVAFYAYLVSGAFLGLSYFDLFYQLVAIAVVLKVLFQRERARVRERGAPASMAPAAPRPTSGPLRPLYAGPRS